MGRVVLDMGSLIPFGEIVEDNRRINQTRYQSTGKYQKQGEPNEAEL
jgi:hypothetical protein